MSSIFPNPAQLSDALSQDGDFMLAARFWTGGIRFVAESETLELTVSDGVPAAGPAGDSNIIELRGNDAAWQPLLASLPPRQYNDLLPAMVAPINRIELNSDTLLFTQYYPAIMRLIEVIRPKNTSQRQIRSENTIAASHDAPVGRYVHINIEGQDYRIYYEEAGTGIPLLLQHTAGAHGTQWRHIFEYPEITEKFRLIAYDLPYHGKSIPPVGSEWWSKPYLLEGEFLRSIPVTLSKALNLNNPVFMGCSVGGGLALDLAYHHPDVFRAVISVEGMLTVKEQEVDEVMLESFYHPQVSNEFKGRLMHGLTGPNSPEAYRQETIQVYKAGWPPAFIGDLHYYGTEYDLREHAHKIDTSKVGVHIMNGEYDSSGSWELGEKAHQAIAGSTWTKMVDLGHFPMCEDPELFVSYLKPILENIEKQT